MQKRGTDQLEDYRCVRVPRVFIRMSHPRKPFVARLNGIVFRGLGDLENSVVVIGNLDGHDGFKSTMAIPGDGPVRVVICPRTDQIHLPSGRPAFVH